MATSVPVKGFLQNRRDRTVGSILGSIETSIKGKLTDDEWKSLRRVVIDSTNSYHDSVLDLMKAEEGVIRNDELIEMLARLERSIVHRQ